MHVKTCLLHDVGDVRTCKCQVLKGASDASVISGICHRVADGGEIGAGVDGRVRRTSVGKYLLCVLALWQDEPGCYALDGDIAKEV